MPSLKKGQYYLLLLMLLMLCSSSARGQNDSIRIGEIEFYGAAGVNLEQLRAALPFREGDTISHETGAQKTERARRAVEQMTGHLPTDVAQICCDDHRDLIIYIGLSGKPLPYRPRPKGKVRLPASVKHLSDLWWQTLQEGIRQGTSAEDWSKGYALSSAYPPLRAIQLRMRSYAVRHGRLLIAVLASAADDEQRAMAAELLGYGRQTRAQLTALAEASRDSNDEVRNNVTRALSVLAASSPSLARQIPADNFIGLLMSGIWTDVNKASGLLSLLTAGRSPALLRQLRRPEVLARLVEITRWRTGHADAGKYILGRVAGIEEKQLQQLVTAKQVDAIINALH